MGSGYHSANFRLTGVKVIDPIVYFGGATYTYNLSTQEDIGKFEPGQSFGFDLGTKTSQQRLRKRTNQGTATYLADITSQKAGEIISKVQGDGLLRRRREAPKRFHLSAR